MSATSKRDRALVAGEEPVTGKDIHQGEAPPPEYLDFPKHLSQAPESPKQESPPEEES